MCCLCFVPGQPPSWRLFSADEGRWVKFSELAADLCALNEALPSGADCSQEGCEVAMVDDEGALKWEKLLDLTSPAKTFERSFAPLYVPPREAVRRPDLAAIRDKGGV